MVEHRIDFKTTAEDFNENGKVKLSSLLYFCQEAATEHADIIGIGADDLLKDNIVWILAKMKVRILDDIKQDENYYIMTYPRAQKSRFCPRDYYMYDAEGNLVMTGSAIWSLMDWTTRKITKHELNFGGELREDEVFPEGFEKIRVKAGDKKGEHVVIPSDIDANEHTNNCRYADMAQQVSEIENVREFVIQFSKETREGECVDLYVEQMDDHELICGKLADDQTVFLARITTA